MKKKTVAILMAAMLVCGGAAGATMAWLTDSTTEIVNTFTYGNIDIDLTEENPEHQMAKMIPGSEIEKDPKVTVEAGSEPCYVFVKITPSENYVTFFGEFTAADVAEGWSSLGSENNVYYQIVNPDDGNPLEEDWHAFLLKGNKVTVLDTVTKENMDMLETEVESEPTLAFTAYAVQLQNIDDVNAAWAQISQE